MRTFESLQEQILELTPEHRAVLRQAFDAVAGGFPIGPSELAAFTRLSMRKISRRLDELEAMGFIQTDKGGAVTGAAGLSLSPTRHRLTVNGQELFTWCAEDAIGIPAALGWNVKVSSSCGDCGSPLTIYMAAGGICEPAWTASVRLWLNDVQEGPICTKTCPYILFFCRQEHSEWWLRNHSQNSGRLITLDEAVNIGRRTWGWMANNSDQGRYDAIGSGWKRRLQALHPAGQHPSPSSGAARNILWATPRCKRSGWGSARTAMKREAECRKLRAVSVAMNVEPRLRNDWQSKIQRAAAWRDEEGLPAALPANPEPQSRYRDDDARAIKWVFKQAARAFQGLSGSFD